MLKTRGFEGDSRQAGPVRPVYNADQPITALKGTGIRTCMGLFLSEDFEGLARDATASALMDDRSCRERLFGKIFVLGADRIDQKIR